MGRKKELEDVVTMSFKTTRSRKKNLEKRARHESAQADRPISVSELIRVMLDTVAPMEQQIDMFGGLCKNTRTTPR